MQKLVSLSLLILCIHTGFAQENPSQTGKPTDRISYGGDFGLSFGSVTYVNISPIAGFRVTENFTAGAGFIYQYLKYRREVYGVEINNSLYGERIFVRYRFLEKFYAISEYQNLHVKVFDPIDLSPKGRVNVPVLFFGAGYLAQISNKVYFNMSLLFDVNQDRNSPYTNPTIQGGLIVNP